MFDEFGSIEIIKAMIKKIFWRSLCDEYLKYSTTLKMLAVEAIISKIKKINFPLELINIYADFNITG